MKAIEAQELVAKTGKHLAESGLIVRTWGNISCRINESYFAVTPSGKAYESLQAEDICVCRISDASSVASGTPSSEKMIHALLYHIRPEVNFVIHTHQKYASALACTSLAGLEAKDSLCSVPLASYGPPGSKKLAAGVKAVLFDANGAIFMANHGALCYGKNREDAFAKAWALEEQCKNFLLKRCGMDEEPSQPEPLRSSRTEASIPAAHLAVYRARRDIRYIETSLDPWVMRVMEAGMEMPPMLDDFAQIIGPSARLVRSKEDVVSALRGRKGVLLQNHGAICCAKTESDAQAARLVLEKNALAIVCSALCGKPAPLSPLESRLLNYLYRRKYSKKI